MASTNTILDPIAVPSNAPREVRTLDGLAGKTIGFIDNAKPNFNYLVDDLGELLKSRYKVAEVIKHANPTRDFSNVALRIKGLKPVFEGEDYSM